MKFNDYHFHLYYPVAQIKEAQAIIEQFKLEHSDIPAGRVWDKPVGPHPIGSCQITATDKNFYLLTEWFFNNRKDFSLFIHAVTGDDYIDHTKYVLWMGKEYQLNLAMFES